MNKAPIQASSFRKIVHKLTNHMKTTSTAVKFMAIAAVFIGLFASHAFAANTPIPGIDIVVRKQPGGSALKATTDKEGRATFSKLEPGSYTVSIPDTSAAIKGTTAVVEILAM